MKAIVKEIEGTGASYKDYFIPEIGLEEVLIKVKATAICGTDIHIFEWNNWAQNAGIQLPTILGHECAGEIVEVGKLVKHLKVGDYVACETHIPCGVCYQCKNNMEHICRNLSIFGVHTDGCFAEYCKIPEKCAVKIPESIDPRVGAVLEPLGTAIRSCVEVEVSGKNIAIIGCGPIGLMAINAARAFGAANIIALDINNKRLGIAKDLGASICINSFREDPVSRILQITNGTGVDAFIDASGSNEAILQGFQFLRKGGAVALIGLPSKKLEIELGSQVIFKEAKIIGIHGRRLYDTWTIMSNLLENGLIDIEPVITHVYELKDFEKGLEIIEKGEAGKVILIP